MPVSEYGEIGRLVKFYPDSNDLVCWAVKAVRKDIDELFGLPTDGAPCYFTSMGWMVGEKDGSDYFAPTDKERSLRPCILRATKHAETKYPGISMTTH